MLYLRHQAVDNGETFVDQIPQRHICSETGCLAPRFGTWHWQDMINSKPDDPRAAGVFLALGAIGGTIVGIVYGQPSIGLLAGLASGGLIALILWLIDRKQN